MWKEEENRIANVCEWNQNHFHASINLYQYVILSLRTAESAKLVLLLIAYLLSYVSEWFI